MTSIKNVLKGYSNKGSTFLNQIFSSEMNIIVVIAFLLMMCIKNVLKLSKNALFVL